MKVNREWFIDAPWGKIALVSWGDPGGSPVLLVHGRQDSAATFIPLLQHLPETYHYVGVDMPGNGRSAPFPHGVKLMRFHFVAAVEVVVKHLGWSQFVYIGHSMGCEQGLFYNAIYPGRIQKLVHLDLGPSLQRLQVQDLVEYYNDFYDNYYSNYHSDSYGTKLYTRRQAIDAVKNARSLTESQAEIILSRNMIHVADDSYSIGDGVIYNNYIEVNHSDEIITVFKSDESCCLLYSNIILSWDRRLKYPAPQNFPIAYYVELFSTNSPPTLLISAQDITSRPYLKGKEAADKILKELNKTLPNFQIVTVAGGHDVHFTHPERLAGSVKSFLSNDFASVPLAKL